MHRSICFVIATCVCYAFAFPTDRPEKSSKSYFNVPQNNIKKTIASDMTIVTHNDLYGKYLQIPEPPTSNMLIGILQVIRLRVLMLRSSYPSH